MGVIVSIGTLSRENPTDPSSRLRVSWPGSIAAGHPSLPGQPMRAFNLRSWAAWQRSRAVRALLAHCRVPADVDHPILAPIDEPLLTRIAAVSRAAERWAWLPWADPTTLERAQWLHAWTQHARATFGERAYLSIS